MDGVKKKRKGYDEKPPVKDDDAVLEEARSRFKQAESADSEDRERAREELAFAWNVDNCQWDDEAKKVRKGRPMLTENRFPSFLRQAVNDIRQSRPAARVLPVDDKGDKFTAHIMEGLIRNIEANSRADMAYDNAVEYAGYCGRGYWKVTTQYLEESFDQEIILLPVKNPFSIFDDPNCKLPDKSDRKFLFEAEWVDNTEFESEFGEKPTEFSEAATTLAGDVGQWFEETKTLVCNYWRIKCEYQELVQFSDGTVTTKPEEFMAQWREQNALAVTAMAAQAEQAVLAGQDAPPIQAPMAPQITKRRKHERKFVEWFTLTGTKVYRKGEWAGKFIPFPFVGGEQIAIGDKNHTKGMTQDSQDLAKANNYLLSAQMEHVALSPKIPFIGPKGAFKTDNAKWNTANQQSYSYIEFDGNIPPQRADQIAPQPELASMKAGVVDGMRAVVGMMGASLGDKGPEVAWRAIAARQSEGDTAVYHLMDNLVRAVRYSAIVMLDIIPKIYDTSRIVRIINPDSKPATMAINQMFVDEQGNQRTIDFSKGKYDVTASAGPAFETQRQQTAATLVDLSNRNPSLFGAAGDIVVKSLALPQAEELAERLKRAVPPHILGEGPTQKEQQLQQQMQQMQQQLQEAGTNLQMLQSELAKQAATLAGKELDNQKKQAELQSELVQSTIDQQIKELDLQKKEAELAATYAKASQEIASTNFQAETDRLISAVQQLMGEQESKVRALVPEYDRPAGPDLTPLFATIAQSNASLQEAIASLTKATLTPRESKVMTPDGRQFSSVSAPMVTQ